MNWAEEKKNTADVAASGFWSPAEGRHRIKIVSDPRFEMKEFKDDKGPKPRANLEIEENNEKKVWGISRSASDKSVWSKLVRLGVFMQNEGKSLVGSTITVRVNGKDKEKSYDIDELYPYIEKQSVQNNKPALTPIKEVVQPSGKKAVIDMSDHPIESMV